MQVEAQEAMREALSGWQYIRRFHGDLYGVGWDRVEEKLTAALASECYGDCRTGEPATCPSPCKFEGRPTEDDAYAEGRKDEAEQFEIIGYTHAYDLDFPFAYASLGPEKGERNIPVYVRAASRDRTAQGPQSSPPSTVQDEQRLQRIAWLIGSIFCFGGFKAETHNERELEKLLRENGTFWESPAEFERVSSVEPGSGR